MKLAWKNRSFRIFLLGGAVSTLGDVMSGLAFLFLAYDLTHSSLHTTGMVIAETLPYLLFGLIGGAVADYVDRKKMMVVIDLLRAPLIASVFFIHQWGTLQYWHLLVFGFLIQSLGCFFNPAHRAVLPLITRPEERVGGNSLLDSVTRGVQVLSPVATVTLLHVANASVFYLLDAASYLISAALLFRLPLATREGEAKERLTVRTIYRSIGEFLAWVWGHQGLLRLYGTTFAVVFLNTWVWQVGLLLHLQAITEDGQAWYSVFQGGYGGVVIMINLLIPFVWKKLSLSTYLLGSAIWGAGVLVMGMAGHLSLVGVAVCIIAAGMPLAGLSRVYLLQHWLPDDRLGRGFSVNAMLLYLSNVLSLAFFGWLSTWVSFGSLAVFCGAGMVILALLTWRMFGTRPVFVHTSS